MGGITHLWEGEAREVAWDGGEVVRGKIPASFPAHKAPVNFSPPHAFPSVALSQASLFSMVRAASQQENANVQEQTLVSARCL